MYTCRLIVKHQFLTPTVKRRLGEICLQVAQANLDGCGWDKLNPKIEVIVNHTSVLYLMYYAEHGQTEVSADGQVLMVICQD